MRGSLVAVGARKFVARVNSRVVAL